MNPLLQGVTIPSAVGMPVNVMPDRLWPVETIGWWLGDVTPARQPRSRRLIKKLWHGTRGRRRGRPMTRQADPYIVGPWRFGYIQIPRTIVVSETQAAALRLHIPEKPAGPVKDWSGIGLFPERPMKYILTGPNNRTPEPATLQQHMEWILAVAPMLDQIRRVGETMVPPGWRVSTVFLDTDHGIVGPPEIFETMIFDHRGVVPRISPDTFCRYSTWAEAVEGHAAAVEIVKAGWPPTIREDEEPDCTDGIDEPDAESDAATTDAAAPAPEPEGGSPEEPGSSE